MISTSQSSRLWQSRIQTFLILSGLALLTLAIYGQVFHHEFVDIDDMCYLTEKPIVQAGLTLKGILWSFKNLDNGEWQPLTWISWMTDCQIFGMHSGWHHLMNVFYHLANVILLFFLMRAITDSVPKAIFATLLFALHPLRVESVAWAAERKDTLSGLFWLAALLSYVSYVKKDRRFFMALTAVFFVMGSMAKPMVISLPFILMLLDYWPLERAQSFRQLVLEKTPLWIIAAANAALACAAKMAREGLTSRELFPVGIRLENAVVSYVRYLEKTFVPIRLAVFYPYPKNGHPVLLVVTATIILILITTIVIGSRKERPHLLVGWFWYLITLLPVIGIVQVGAQSMADRFTYIPHMGLFLALTWEIFTWFSAPRFKNLKTGGIVLASIVFATLALLSWKQTGYWRSSLTLNEHALQVTRDNYFAHASLGLYYERKGDLQKSAYHYGQSIAINPRDANVLNNLGNMLLRMGRFEEAEAIYSVIEQTSEKDPQALVNLGIVFSEKKEWGRAEDYFKRALEKDPSRIKAILGLANIEITRGNYNLAKNYLDKALLIAPEDEEVNYMAGNLEIGRKNYAAARSYYEKTLKINPLHFKAAYNLGNILFLNRQYQEALSFYQRAVTGNPNFSLAYLQAGKTYSQMGDIEKATAYYQETLRLSPHHPEAEKLLQDITASNP